VPATSITTMRYSRLAFEQRQSTNISFGANFPARGEIALFFLPFTD